MKNIKNKKVLPNISSNLIVSTAFLLLIFFIIFISVNANRNESQDISSVSFFENCKYPSKIKSRNLLKVYMDGENRVFINSSMVDTADIVSIVKDFIDNPDNEVLKPEKEEKEVPYFGPFKTASKQFISLSINRGATFESFLFVQNKIKKAYAELRNDLAEKKWQKKYVNLSDMERSAIRLIYPQHVFEIVNNK